MNCMDMAEGFERQAIGVFELDSYLSCFVALDAAAKAGNSTSDVFSITSTARIASALPSTSTSPSALNTFIFSSDKCFYALDCNG